MFAYLSAAQTGARNSALVVQIICELILQGVLVLCHTLTQVHKVNQDKN